ncbi:MAG: YraN family protein [Roseobacter sp.]|jgi:putative endonuclease
MEAARVAREHKGRTSYHAGQAAEQAVARAYLDRGCRMVAQRWRAAGGEIDLVFAHGDGFVFVEVKKSRTCAQAAYQIRPRQTARILAAASAFVADQPAGQLTEMRFDAALVDSQGRIDIIENALSTG